MVSGAWKSFLEVVDGRRKSLWPGPPSCRRAEAAAGAPIGSTPSPPDVARARMARSPMPGGPPSASRRKTDVRGLWTHGVGGFESCRPGPMGFSTMPSRHPRCRPRLSFSVFKPSDRRLYLKKSALRAATQGLDQQDPSSPSDHPDHVHPGFDTVAGCSAPAGRDSPGSSASLR